MAVMLTVTGIVIADIIVRLLQYNDGYANFSTMILSILAGALVSYGATYGGSLVYDYQFNVEPGWLDRLGRDGNRSDAGR
jgi:uncharacterized membrane protein